MNRTPIDSVDVFHGNGAVDTPVPRGVAAAWNWLKAQVGNTHPGACRPFGMVSACAYSGAYPTGYGLYDVSSDGPTPLMFDRKTAIGFTHFQQSGTGGIGVFYNYLRVIPFTDDFPGKEGRWDLRKESARPGYYACELAETGISAELTVGARTAHHRYRFPATGIPGIAIDLGNGGVHDPERGTRPTVAAVTLTGSTSARGHLVLEGFPIYFQVEVAGDVESASLWADEREIKDTESMQLPSANHPAVPSTFGVLFTGLSEQTDLRIGFSFRGLDEAQRHLRSAEAAGFDAVREAAHSAWRDVVERIRVEGGTDDQREIFYTSMYRSFIKPTDCRNESPYWNDDSEFFIDFATMWDIYKTTLPLLMTVQPEQAGRVIRAMLRTIEHFGYFPNMMLMQAHTGDGYDMQARHLSHPVIADAFLRGLNDVDWNRAKDLMSSSLENIDGRSYIDEGRILPCSHSLDMAAACHATAVVARGVGDHALAERMALVAGTWRNSFDPATGLLDQASEYYEGTYWSYSFRLLHDMASRIEICGGEESFVKLLDTFFGFTDIAEGRVDPAPRAESWQRVIRDHRFQGLNNESDMETPYAYIYAGRHDRTAEIVRAVMRYQFTTGPGGLPGNEDSGGLSAWYVWNAIGLFPVSGQDLYLIGSPIFDAATLQLADGEFRIDATNNSPDNIYVQAATIDGRPVDRAWLRVGEVRGGGSLELEMGPAPSKWACDNRPFNIHHCGL